jgi:RNA polymerase nonessential primary-like sigma factor
MAAATKPRNPAQREPVKNNANVSGDTVSEQQIEKWVKRSSLGNLSSVSSLSAYTRRMEQYPQLKAAEQIELAYGVKAARAEIEKIQSKKKPAASDERRIRELRAYVDKASETLAGSSFRLVLLICRELAEERHGRERALDVMPDLVGEANVALVEAIMDFDVERCPLFATYAARVIRDRVRALLGRDGAIRLPPSWNRLKRIAAVRIPQLGSELGRPPTREEIYNDLLARCLAWAESKLTEEQAKLPKKQRLDVMMAKLRKQGMIGALDSLDDVLQASQGTASLDATVSDDGGATLGDMMSAEASSSLLDDVEHDELRDLFARVLSGLDERERRIVIARYGLDGSEPRTYVEIGEVFGVTAERVRQIERAVLGKIREGDHSGNLSAFLYQ